MGSVPLACWRILVDNRVGREEVLGAKVEPTLARSSKGSTAPLVAAAGVRRAGPRQPQCNTWGKLASGTKGSMHLPEDLPPLQGWRARDVDRLVGRAEEESGAFLPAGVRPVAGCSHMGRQPRAAVRDGTQGAAFAVAARERAAYLPC